MLPCGLLSTHRGTAEVQVGGAQHCGFTAFYTYSGLNTRRIYLQVKEIMLPSETHLKWILDLELLAELTRGQSPLLHCKARDFTFLIPP